MSKSNANVLLTNMQNYNIAKQSAKLGVFGRARTKVYWV